MSCVESGIPTRYSRVSQDEDLNILTNMNTGSLVDATYIFNAGYGQSTGWI